MFRQAVLAWMHTVKVEEVVAQRCCNIGDKTPTYVRKEEGSLSGHFALYKYHERQQ